MDNAILTLSLAYLSLSLSPLLLLLPSSLPTYHLIPFLPLSLSPSLARSLLSSPFSSLQNPSEASLLCESRPVLQIRLALVVVLWGRASVAFLPGQGLT